MKKLLLLIFLTTSCWPIGSLDMGHDRPEGVSNEDTGSHGDNGNSGANGGGAGGEASPENSKLFSQFDNLKGDPFGKYYQQAFDKVWHDSGDPRKKRQNGRPGGMCARYAKKIYMQMGCLKSYPSGNANTQVGEFKSRGFTLLGTKNPCEAPIGSVIVYGGGGYGHIEVKTPKGYLSDYLSRGPRTAGLGLDNVVSRDEFNRGEAKLDNTKCKSSGDRRFVLGILVPPKDCLKG